MDDFALVESVKRHKCIYAHNTLDYRIKKKRVNAWAEIGTALKVDVSHCLTRWKSIRDRFVRECSKMRMRGSDAYDPASSWKLFPSLMFLKEYVKPRRKRTGIYSLRSRLPLAEVLIDSSGPIDYEEHIDSRTIKVSSSPQHYLEAENDSTFNFGEDEKTSGSMLFDESHPSEAEAEAVAEAETRTSEQFVTFLENIQTLVEQRQRPASERKHEGFVQMTLEMLDALPERDQRNSKMFILNYLHEKTKVASL